MAEILSHRAKKYIEKNYQSIHILDQIAIGIDCNYHTLREKFVRETGITLCQYLNWIRCIKAKYYLEKSDWKLYQIARELGFNDEKYFIKVFEKYFNISPNRYRKQSKLNIPPHKSAQNMH
jgi:AraC-like DNA-binding protein